MHWVDSRANMSMEKEGFRVFNLSPNLLEFVNLDNMQPRLKQIPFFKTDLGERQR
jgi:hypothetical protein